MCGSKPRSFYLRSKVLCAKCFKNSLQMQALPLYRKDRLRLGRERHPGTCKMTSLSSETNVELLSLQDSSVDIIHTVSTTTMPLPKLS